MATTAPLLQAQSVQLADGQVLLVSVEEYDGDGLRVRRLDNGGMLDLRWDHLSAASAHQLKRRFDLIGDAQDELLVRADEVTYLSNGTRQSVIGRITDASSDPMIVQVKGVTYPIPRRNLQGVRKVEVPAVQVYTKAEFYTQSLGKHAPGESSDKHMLLAEDLIKFRDYDRAAEHLDKAKEFGNTKNQQQLDTLIDRLRRFKAAAKELGMLEQIQVARSRGKLKDFEKGVALIAKFEADFPQTKLKSEFEREKNRFDKARTRYLTQSVADQWRRSIRKVAEKYVGGAGTTLQGVRDYAENKMTDDIVARLKSTLRLESQEIVEMWGNRAKYTVGKRTEHFDYGIGSWVLDPKAIIKDTAVGKAKEKAGTRQAPVSGKDREIERFAKLLAKAMERRRNAAQSGGETREQSDEGWWKDASRGERISWLRAYYAEFGGQLVVKFATVRQCISCYGEGTTPTINGDGKMVRSKCFLCQGTKWLRSFKAY